MLEMAVGGLAALLLTDWRAEVTLGFLRLCAVLLVPLALLALLVPGTHPSPLGLLLWIALLGTLAYGLLLVIRPAALVRRPLAGVGVVAGALALGLLVFGGSVPGPQRVLLLVGVVADTLVLGAAEVGLVLGHWYLVTPRLTARPLRRLVDLLLLGLLLALVVLIWPLVVGTVPALSLLAWDAVHWGRIIAALALPLAFTLAARACCLQWPRGRALQAATGLLYVASASAFAGVLLGNLLRLGPATPT